MRTHPVARAFHATERFVARPRVRATLIVLAVAALFAQQAQIKVTQNHAAATDRRLGVLIGQNRGLALRLKAQVHREATNRVAEIRATVQARYSNCEDGNKLRAGLRTNVLQQQKTLPLFFRLLPQFDTQQIRRINRERVAEQLGAFAALDCGVYAREILPGHARPRKHRPRVANRRLHG